MNTIVIIGGGVTGLTAAYSLQKMIQIGRLRARVILIEAQPELGGKIRSLRADGFIMETGADSIVSRKSGVATYMEELGLQDEVVYNATGRSFLYLDGRLQLIPEDTIFGIPLSVESLAKSELISAEGKVAALRDLYTPNDRFTLDDSAGSFLRYFLGDELVDRQIAPVLAGVYSGKLDELTLASTLPDLLKYKNEYGSIIQGLDANRDRFKSAGGGKFLSFGNGLSQLIERLEQRIPDVQVLKGVKVERLTRSADRYILTLSNGSSLTADSAILSILHTHAAQLFPDDGLDELFGQFTTNSLISVYLGYDAADELLPTDGTGFIVVDGEELSCSACTWTSRKWAHTSAGGKLLVRLFYKNSHPRYEELARLSDDDIVQAARRDISLSMGLDEQPVLHAVTRWHQAMPSYQMGHRSLVSRLEERLASHHPGIILAGCSYYGVGIPDCMQSGERAASLAAEYVGLHRMN